MKERMKKRRGEKHDTSIVKFQPPPSETTEQKSDLKGLGIYFHR